MKRDKLRKVLVAVLIMVLVGSGVLLACEMLDYRAGDKAYTEAAEIAAIPWVPEQPAQKSEEQLPSTPAADPYAQVLANMDLSALRAVNSDVIGWIMIPETEISYPMVQGADNDSYLNHMWNRSSSVVGAIFMDCRSASDLSGFNTIVYGHRMNNGSMFAGLKYYKEQGYWQAHPRIYVTNASGTYTYKIYAAYEVLTDGMAYCTTISDTMTKRLFVQEGISASQISTGIVPSENDHILTLSTCTGRGHETRWVVQAVLE